MRSCCPIPFAKIKYEGKYLYPVHFKCSGYSPTYFSSLEFLNNNKKYLIEGIYHNVEFKNKAVRFCYA